MRTSWVALHASLNCALNCRSAEAKFQAMRQSYSELTSFSSIASLMENQHKTGRDPATRYRIVRALVTAAQSDQHYRSTAHLMVMTALWPGLDAVFWRIARGFPIARDDLSSELLSRVSEAILALDLGKVEAVAATLLRNVERDMRRDLIAARIIEKAARPIDDPPVEAVAAAASEHLVIDHHDLACHFAGLAERDANLLCRIFLLGETQEEAGRAVGLSHDAARKRYQRALAKLGPSQKNPRG